MTHTLEDFQILTGPVHETATGRAWATALQHADGDIDPTDPPHVWIECNSEEPHSAGQARELAAAILAATADADRWQQ